MRAIDIVILAVIAVFLFAAFGALRRFGRKKKRENGCMGCSGCSCAAACHLSGGPVLPDTCVSGEEPGPAEESRHI